MPPRVRAAALPVWMEALCMTVESVGAVTRSARLALCPHTKPCRNSLPRPGRNAGIPWADRFAYCQPGSSLEPGVELSGRCAPSRCTHPFA